MAISWHKHIHTLIFISMNVCLCFEVKVFVLWFTPTQRKQTKKGYVRERALRKQHLRVNKGPTNRPTDRLGTAATITSFLWDYVHIHTCMSKHSK